MINPSNKIEKIIARVLIVEESEITDTLSRKSVKDWDSLAHLLLINEIETAFSVVFSDDDILEINTIGDLKKKLRIYGIET